MKSTPSSILAEVLGLAGGDPTGRLSSYWIWPVFFFHRHSAIGFWCLVRSSS